MTRSFRKRILAAPHGIDLDDKKPELGDWMGEILIFQRGSIGLGFAWWQCNCKRMTQFSPVALNLFEQQFPENQIKAIDPFLRKGVHTWVCSCACNFNRFRDIRRSFRDPKLRNPDLKRDYGDWIYGVCATDYRVKNAFEVIRLGVWESCRNRGVCKMSLMKTTVITSSSVLSTLSWELSHDLVLAFVHSSEPCSKRGLD